MNTAHPRAASMAPAAARWAAMNGGDPYPGGFDHPTMLTRAEIDCLHGVAANLAGVGRVVEVGCFLGGSTRAILAGLEAAGRAGEVVISHDRFVVERPSQTLHLRHLRAGDSFRAVHRRLMSDWAERVEVREGTLPEDAGGGEAAALYPEGEAVELLFLDFAGSAGLHRTALGVWGSRLVPGAGVLFEQDFRYPRLHWVALHAWLLRGVLEPLRCVGDGGSCVFGVTGDLGAALGALPRVEAMSAAEIGAAWDGAAAWFGAIGWGDLAWSSAMFRANHLASNGFAAEAASAIEGAASRGEVGGYGHRPMLADLRERMRSGVLGGGSEGLARLDGAIGVALGRGREVVAEREVERQRARASWYWGRLWAGVERGLVGSGALRVALYGAGAHTERLLGAGWPWGGGVEVACVVDDGAAGGGSLCGVPVVRPSAMPAGVDAVVLSSDAHELALLGAVRRAFGGGVRVVSPYGSDGASAGAGSGDAGVFVAA